MKLLLSGLVEFLAAIGSFVMGIDSRFFDTYDQPSDVNAVDLDTCSISLCTTTRHLSTKLLPKKAARTLKNTLTQLQVPQPIRTQHLTLNIQSELSMT